MKEEKDPNGVAPNQPGAKLDHGKLRAGLVIKGFQNALKAVAEVGTFGANKYTDDGWKSVPDGLKRYEDALYRHLLADGMDEQSGLPHLAHAAWNILAMLELLHRKCEDDKVLIAAVKKWSSTPKLNSTEIVDRELFKKSRFYVDGVDLTERGDDVVDIAIGSLELGPRDFEGLLREKGLRVSPIAQSEAEKACQGALFTAEEALQFQTKELRKNGYIDRIKRNNDRIRDIVAGTHFTDKEKVELANPECRLFSFSDQEHAENVLLATWQFSREMWEFAYCNPKNAKLFEMVKEEWASHKSKSGVSVVLLNKDCFNASDLVVDGIHIPSLPKELINAALLRCYPLGASRFSSVATLLIKAGIGFIDQQENK